MGISVGPLGRCIFFGIPFERQWQPQQGHFMATHYNKARAVSGRLWSGIFNLNFTSLDSSGGASGVKAPGHRESSTTANSK